MDELDEHDGDDERGAPPVVSRLNWVGDRRHRILNRASTRYRNRDRLSRLWKQLSIGELIGRLVTHHRLTDEVRQACVCVYWPEIVGERIASKTFPTSLAAGVLQVFAINSPWVHELHFLKAQLITQTNNWVNANRVWLGPPPLVLDMRFMLAMKQREPLVDQEHVRRLRLQHARRVKPHTDAPPPVASDADRAAIRAETRTIADAELRDLIEGIRLKWSR